MIVGHALVRDSLNKRIPQVTLLYGPESIGKYTLIREMLKEHNFPERDVIDVAKLTRRDARDILDFAASAPYGDGKFVVLNLDDASEEALNSLLKLIEEPPSYVGFLMYASKPVPDTISSRAFTFHMGRLSTGNVARILSDKLGIDPSRAHRAARSSDGQVNRALEFFNEESAVMNVSNVLKALATKDKKLFEAAVSRWSKTEHDLLMTWASEATSGVWNRFDEESSYGLQNNKTVIKNMLTLYGMSSRPRLLVKSAYSNLLRQ